jgi:TPR repeat protein
VHWYRQAAEQGYAPAQYNLGNKYAKGEVVAKNAVQAVHWYRQAAEQGYAPAQYNLGNKYAKGEVVAKDVLRAVRLCRQAAEQGYAQAQNYLYNLGCHLETSGEYSAAIENYRAGQAVDPAGARSGIRRCLEEVVRKAKSNEPQ